MDLLRLLLIPVAVLLVALAVLLPGPRTPFVCALSAAILAGVSVVLTLVEYAPAT